MTSQRDAEGVQYSLSFQFGECLPTVDELGEPIDEALADQRSLFVGRLMQTSPQDTIITIFVYPDSFSYLRDVKKLLTSLGFSIALRPLPEEEPIAVSPNGTASSTY